MLAFVLVCVYVYLRACLRSLSRCIGYKCTHKHTQILQRYQSSFQCYFMGVFAGVRQRSVKIVALPRKEPAKRNKG